MMYSTAFVNTEAFILHSNIPNSTQFSARRCIQKPNLPRKAENPNFKSPISVYNSSAPSPTQFNGKACNMETWSASNLTAVDETHFHSTVLADSLKLLEWPNLCEAVAAFAGTSLGKEALKEQLSSLHLSQEESEVLLSETAAAIEFIQFSSDSMDFNGLHTVKAKSAIDRMTRGFVIDGVEALAIATFLQFGNALQSTLKIAIKEDAECYTRFMPITDMINDMVISQALIRTVLQLVDEEGSLKDDASSELKRARNQVRLLERRLYELMNNILRDGGHDNSSQEVSYIDGRWCIRAGVDQASGFEGLLLWSGTGVEKYVEPVSAVPLNDELAQARALVAKAEHEVLANLTKKVLPHLNDIQLLLSSVIQLDVIMARAKYSLAFGGTRPILCCTDADVDTSSMQSDAENQDGSVKKSSSDYGEDWLLHLQKAYHPLLLQHNQENIRKAKQKVNATASQLRRAKLQAEKFSSRESLEILLKSLEKEVASLEASHPIPIDILIKRKTKVLIITGPNTGGKTATMKTVGLAALMAKSGLYVLAAEPVIIPCFDSIFADIGDEQSLSQSLSTFSGHLHRIKGIQAQSTGCSLVLLDEVGAGTNPLEGAALGMSLLESFANNGSFLTIATTHQGELKTLKYRNGKFENACAEFDEENLRPTYKLLWGIPGRSNAISIAERLGLPMELVDNAQQIYGIASAEINEVIIDLERTKQDFHEDLQEAEYCLMQSRILCERLITVNKQILEHSTLQQYRKAQEVFAAAAIARSALHSTLRNFHEGQEKCLLTTAQSSRNERTVDVNLSDESSLNHLPGNTDRIPYIGQLVHVPSLGKKAKVLKVNENKNEIVVQSGDLKLNLTLSEWRTS
eukprot:Gb_17316 [translate_table: standard]